MGQGVWNGLDGQIMKRARMLTGDYSGNLVTNGLLLCNAFGANACGERSGVESARFSDLGALRVVLITDWVLLCR